MAEAPPDALEPLLDSAQLREVLNLRDRGAALAWCEAHGVPVLRVGGRYARVRPADVRAGLDRAAGEAEAQRSAAA